MKRNQPTEAPKILVSHWVDVSETEFSSPDQAFEFIKAIYLQMADYDFTKRLADHFASEIEKEDAVEFARTEKNNG